MKHHVRSGLIIALLLFSTGSLCADPSLYKLSLFAHENVCTTSPYGGMLTLSLGKEILASIRVHPADTTIAVHLTHIVHGQTSPIRGSLSGSLTYHSYGRHNGTTSLLAAYLFQASTSSKAFPTIFSTSLGLYVRSSWSQNYDNNLWNLGPHIALSVSQGFFDRLYATLFMTTDRLCMPENNFSPWYGLSLAVSLSENLLLVIRPSVRFSDLLWESCFVTARELSCSLCWTNGPSRKRMMQTGGIWQ